MRLSVVICTRDRPTMFADALASVVACRYTPYEVIVVDQSGDARTHAVVARVQDRTPPVVYLSAPPRGLAAARNLGAARATGEVVAYTDDDCLADSEWLRSLADEFRSSPDIVGVCGRSLPLIESPVVAGGASVRTDPYRRRFRGARSPWEVGNGCNMAFTRRALGAAGPFDERLGPGTACRGGEEVDLLYRLLKLGHTLLYSPYPLVYHRQWRDIAEQLALARYYGTGVGAFAAKHLRSGDVRAARMLGGWARATLLELGRALAARQQNRARAAANFLVGLVIGLKRMALAPPLRPRGSA